MRLLQFSLHWQILIAILLAIPFGFFLYPAVPYVAWMGVVFLKLLKLITVPLILTSIIGGISSIEHAADLGRIGLKTMIFYLATSLLAILTGLLLVDFFRPGDLASSGFTPVDNPAIAEKSISQILIDIIPENIWKALSEGNMLAVILISIMFGVVIQQLPADNKIFLNRFFTAFGDLIMTLTNKIILLAPFGIFGIVAHFVGSQANNPEGLIAMSGALGKYFAIVVAGILFHSLFNLSIILKFAARVKVFRHLSNMSSVLLTAFTTSSSNATLPLTIRDVTEKSGVSPRIAGFTLPLGATVNMNGTALYECVAVIFIAQAYGIELSFFQQAIVVLTSLLAAIGSAGIPMAGLVMMSIILNAVGLPLEGIGLILAVDRPLDMLRTSLNVYGDTCGAVFVARSEGERLSI
jgi:proton glutamate symport protein